MNRIHSRLVTAAVAALLWAGCGPPTSVHPLSDPATAVVDHKLEGTWLDLLRGERENDTITFRAQDEHLLEVTTSDGKGKMQAFSTTLNGQTYLNVQDLTKDDPNDRAAYLFARYHFEEDGTLVILLLNEDPVAEAIQQGQLAGQVTGEKNSRDVRITDTTENLARWIAAAPAEKVYAEPMRMKKKAAK